MYIIHETQRLAYEEILNSLSIRIVVFQLPIRDENPETPTQEKNGKKRCFTQRTSDQEHPKLFKRVICTKNKGNRFRAPGDELT
jgi:hypothetical protein